MTKFGTVAQVLAKRISKVQPRPKGQGPSVPQILGPLPTPTRFDLERAKFGVVTQVGG